MRFTALVLCLLLSALARADDHSKPSASASSDCKTWMSIDKMPDDDQPNQVKGERYFIKTGTGDIAAYDLKNRSMTTITGDAVTYFAVYPTFGVGISEDTRVSHASFAGKKIESGMAGIMRGLSLLGVGPSDRWMFLIPKDGKAVLLRSFPEGENKNFKRQVYCSSAEVCIVHDSKHSPRRYPLQVKSAEHETLIRAGIFTEQSLAPVTELCRDWSDPALEKRYEADVRSAMLACGLKKPTKTADFSKIRLACTEWNQKLLPKLSVFR